MTMTQSPNTSDQLRATNDRAAQEVSASTPTSGVITDGELAVEPSYLQHGVRAVVPPGVGRARHASTSQQADSAAEVVRLHAAAVQLGNRVVWRDAELSVTAGELIAVLGPNGAGKSTLLRVLLGLLRASEGSVQVFGRVPRRGDGAIGYVPQRRNLDPDLPVRGRDLVQL